MSSTGSVTDSPTSSTQQWTSADRNRLFDYLALETTAVFSVPVKLGKQALNQMLQVGTNVDEVIGIVEKLNTRALQYESVDALVVAMRKEAQPGAEGMDKQSSPALLHQPQPQQLLQPDLQALEHNASAAEEAKSPQQPAEVTKPAASAEQEAYREKIRARRVERLKQSGVFSMSVTAQDRNKLFDYLALDTTLIFSEAVKLGKKELSDLLLVGATADETIRLIQTLNAANKSYPTVELLGEAMEALQQQEQQLANSTNSSTSSISHPAPKAQSPPPAPAKDRDLLFECLNDLDCMILPDTAPLYESTIQLLLALCGHSGETAVKIVNGFNAKKVKFKNTDELAQAMANEVKTSYKDIKPLTQLPSPTATSSPPPPTATVGKSTAQASVPSPSPSGSPSLTVPERTTSPTMPTPDRDQLFECLNDLDCTILPDTTPLYDSTITRLLALCGNSGPTAVKVIQTLNKRKMKFKTVDELAEAVATEVKNVPSLPPLAPSTALPAVETKVSSATKVVTTSSSLSPSTQVSTSLPAVVTVETKSREEKSSSKSPLPSALKKPSPEKNHHSHSTSSSSSQQFLSPKAYYSSSSSSSKSTSSHSRSSSNSPARSLNNPHHAVAPVMLTPMQKPATTAAANATTTAAGNPRHTSAASLGVNTASPGKPMAIIPSDPSNPISPSVFYQSNIHSKYPTSSTITSTATKTTHINNNTIQPSTAVLTTTAAMPPPTTTSTTNTLQPIARTAAPKRVTFAASLTRDESLAHCFRYLDPLSFLCASRANKLWLLAARSPIVWTWCKDTSLSDLTTISPIAHVRLESLQKLHDAAICFSTTSSKGLALARDHFSKSKAAATAASRAMQDAAASKLQLVSMFTQILKLDVKCDFQSVHHESVVMDPATDNHSSSSGAAAAAASLQYVSPSEKLHAILFACTNLKSLKLELLHPLCRNNNNTHLIQPTQIQQRPLLATFTPSLLLHLRNNLLHLDLTVQPAPIATTTTTTTTTYPPFSKSLVQQCEPDMNHSTHIFHLLTLNLTRLQTFAWNWKMNPESTMPDTQKSAPSDHGHYLQLSTLLYLKDLRVLKLTNVEFTRTAAKVIVQLSSQHALRVVYWNSNPSLQLLRIPDNSPTIVNEKQAFDALTAASSAMVGHSNSKPLLERFEWIQPVSHPLSATGLRSVLGLPSLQHARIWCREIADMPTILAVIVGRKLEHKEKPLLLKSLDICCVDSTSNPLNLPVPASSTDKDSAPRLSHDEQVTLAWTAAAARLNTLTSLTLRHSALTASALLNLAQPNNTAIDPKASSSASSGRGGGVALQSLRLVHPRFSLGVLPTLLTQQRFPSLTSLEFVRDRCNDVLFSRALMKSALTHSKLKQLSLIRCPSLIIDQEFAQAIQMNTSLEMIQIVPARCATEVGGACHIDVASLNEEVEISDEDFSNESILTPVSQRRSAHWTAAPASHPAMDCCHRCRTDYQLLKQAALNNYKLQIYFRYHIV